MLQLGLLDEFETTSTRPNDSTERVLSSVGEGALSSCRRLSDASQLTKGTAGEDDGNGGVAEIKPEPMRSYWSWRCKQVQQMNDEIKSSDPR